MNYKWMCIACKRSAANCECTNPRVQRIEIYCPHCKGPSGYHMVVDIESTLYYNWNDELIDLNLGEIKNKEVNRVCNDCGGLLLNQEEV